MTRGYRAPRQGTSQAERGLAPSLLYGLVLAALGLALLFGAPPTLAAEPVWPTPPRPVPMPPTAWESKVCGMVTSAAEQALTIPHQLLAAVARAESGRWNAERQASFAWPWTVTAEGFGRYFETKAEAIAAVRRLHARGTRNIDVGCMQVNLFYHPDAFRNLDDAFDPMKNAIYAARLLKSLHDDSRSQSWTNAVALYHSSNPTFKAVYAAKVGRLWYDEYRRAQAMARAAQADREAALANGKAATGE